MSKKLIILISICTMCLFGGMVQAAPFGNGDFETPCDGKYANQYDRKVIVSLARFVRPKTVIEYGLQAGAQQ